MPPDRDERAREVAGDVVERFQNDSGDVLTPRQELRLEKMIATALLDFADAAIVKLFDNAGGAP